MKTITIMRGLPGAGKSTLCEKLVTAETVRINKDLLREMFHCRQVGIENEFFIRKMEYFIADKALNDGKNIILDGTNLGSLSSWHELSEKHEAEVILRDVPTSVSDCMDQDRERGRKGGRRTGKFFIGLMAMFKFFHHGKIN